MWGHNPTEKDVEGTILRLLNLSGFFAIKMNSVGIWDQVKKCYRRPKSPFIIRGVSDVMAWFPGGRFLAVEVKSATGRPTEEQLNFINRLRKLGHLAVIARSWEDVTEYLDAEFPQWRKK